MTPEGKVKTWLTEALKKALPGCIIYKPPGGPFGRAGEPDLHICYHGLLCVIEVKAEGQDPTPLQTKRLQDYQTAGAIAAVIRGKDFERLAIIVDKIMEKSLCLPQDK